MLFTEDNFRDGEMRRLIPVSTGLSWQKLAPSLAAAQHDYLLPLLGKRLNTEINGIYHRERTSRTEAESEVLLWARRAVANLALWSHFDALNLRISDQGFQRQGSEDWQPAFKYQEDALRQQFAHDGFNALDALLATLEAHQDEFQALPTSPAWAQSRRDIVRSTTEIQDIYDIHHSRLIYLRMAPVMRQIQELTLQPIIGDKLYSALIAWLHDGQTEADGHTYTDSTWEQLRDRCRKVMVMAAVQQLLRTTGSVTDRGAYFSQVAATGGGNESVAPIPDVRLQLMLTDAEKALKGYTARLTSWVNANMAELSGGSALGVLDTDNDGRAAFWA